MSETAAKENRPAGRQGKLTAEQKFGVGILVFFSMAVLAFGLWQFSYRVKAPFAGRATGLKNFKSFDQQKLEAMLAKQSQDTDGDGLSDFDEEYVYKTSPYLADSDSDGYPDKQEIDSGNDPNCPSGKTCGLPDVTNTNTSVAAGGAETTGAGGANTNTGDVSAMQTILSGQATADEIRATLRAQGVSDDVLSKVDDKTLLDAYSEVLKETNSAGALQNINLSPSSDLSNTNIPANTNSANNVLAGLSPADARDLLRQAGVDEATLSKLDDATLMQIVAEAMKQQ
jgi:hypothetical protein